MCWVVKTIYSSYFVFKAFAQKKPESSVRDLNQDYLLQIPSLMEQLVAAACSKERKSLVGILFLWRNMYSGLDGNTYCSSILKCGSIFW